MIKKKPEVSPRRRPYRQLPHTADLAWRLWGCDLPELFENAGRALSAFAPVLIGVLADRFGIGSALAATALFYVAGAGAMLFLPETRGEALS